ncbi:o-succinylbenzoate synthase [Nostocoides sp. F2B08]|uniref:o-succinylbenzoate synthase n=1 Tax=Nostocoides sp. F2B08 TaxID=2653936 RepID=UPI001263641A|nr:o-succinylbenzoate synthase [Tetrasphaera sp. F2B08]KAB7746440.1 o-succinylbenzoate synthase [Tetrasphaera sp. F2B08]
MTPTAEPCPSERPSVADLVAAMHVVSVPMRVRFRGVTRREVAVLHGPAGWGEFGPFLEYAPVEAARWLAAAVEAAWEGPPPALRNRVPVNATVPAVGPERVGEVLDRFPGATTVKVKVAESGEGLADDLDRVAAVRAHLGRDGLIRVDANGGWDVEQARDALRRLSAYGLEYAEQPCASVEELAGLRRALARDGTEVPVAADESIRRAEDPLRVRDLEAADVVVVKVAPLGGVRAALRIVQECGLPAVVSSALETSVGIAAGVALAAALPDLPYACGLGTVALLDGDVSADPLLPSAGGLPVRPVTVDPELLQRFAVPGDRRRWWADRVEASAAYL